MLSRSTSLAIAFVVLLVLGVFASRANLRTDMRAMMPSTEHSAGAVADEELARALVDSAMNQSVLIFFRSENTDIASLATQFSANVRTNLGTRARVVTAGPDAGFEEAFYRLYFPRRSLFWPEDLLRGADVAPFLDARVATTVTNLTSPLGALHSRTASADPLSLFALALERVRDVLPVRALDSEDGVFRVSYQGQSFSVMLVELAQSPLGSDNAHAIDSALTTSIASMRATDASFDTHVAGIHRFALAAEARIRADVTRVSIASTLFIVLLFGLLFRGVRVLLLSMIPLIGGVFAGMCLTQLCFGEVHGLALAFGSSLLGVGIDFVAHLASSSLFDEEQGASVQKTMRTVLPGLLLGASTTILGLFALAFGTVPALRQLAVFAGGSVAAALVLTLLVLPPWLAGLRATAPMQRLANTLEHLTEARGRRFSCVALVIGLLFACFGYARANLVDDIRALRSDDQSLRLEMTAMQRALGQDSSPTLLVSTARTEQEALAVNERLYRSLRSRIGQEHVHSIAPFLPSLADQEQRAAAFRERAPQLEPEITSALERAGLDASQFSSAQPAFVRIAPSDLLNSPLRSLLRPFRVVARSGVHYLTYVETHVPDLEALVARVPGAQIFSEASYLQRAYARFRARTGRLVVVGLVLVFAICALRYRSWKRGALAIVPALAASFIAVGVAAFWSHQIHLLHFAAVLMVLSMGEDYAVFMLEVRDARETKGTLVGIFLAAATTVVSFLLLAFSHEPALAALGQVVSIGIVYSFLLAPLVRRVAPFHP